MFKAYYIYIYILYILHMQACTGLSTNVLGIIAMTSFLVSILVPSSCVSFRAGVPWKCTRPSFPTVLTVVATVDCSSSRRILPVCSSEMKAEFEKTFVLFAVACPQPRIQKSCRYILVDLTVLSKVGAT